MVFLFLANGFEEVEALAPLDLMRRAGVEVTTVGIGGSLITGAHGITVKADIVDSALSTGNNIEAVVLPGGMPGATNLDASDAVDTALAAADRAGAYLCAICAAPMVLGSLGLLDGRKATCYPGFESHLTGADYTADLVPVDGNIVTGKGPAAAFPYAYTILSLFVDDETVKGIKEGMMYV